MLKIHSGESSVPETTANLALERFVNLFAGTYLPVEENYVIFFLVMNFIFFDGLKSVGFGRNHFFSLFGYFADTLFFFPSPSSEEAGRMSIGIHGIALANTVVT